MHPQLREPDRPVEAVHADGPAWSVQFGDGTERRYGDGDPRFTFVVPDRGALERLLAGDAYSAGVGFVRGDFDVSGDLEAAIRFKGWLPRSGWRERLLDMAARGAAVFESRFRPASRAVRDVRYHYDRPDAFYRLFLDTRLVYSCAYFRSPEMTLEEAQEAKLEHVCRKLDLQPGERFLDIGCGWGALVLHAAIHYGAAATGCTLSRSQYDGARALLGDRAAVLESDYRTVGGRYDKIASVGMFEHVGPRRAREYFGKIADLLAPQGLFLNHAIARAEDVRDDAASLFVRRYVFPGGLLSTLAGTIQAAEEGGLEILDVENLRPHYARTCRIWERRLAENREAALRLVDQRTYRTWRIWLAGSAVAFEEGSNSVYQVLMAKRGSGRRRLTREYVYS